MFIHCLVPTYLLWRSPVWPDVEVSPIFPKSYTKTLPMQFLHKSNVFQNSPKRSQSFGLLLLKILLPRTFKNRPSGHTDVRILTPWTNAQPSMQFMFKLMRFPLFFKKKSRPLFLFSSFQYSWQLSFNINYSNEWIRTAGPKCCKNWWSRDSNFRSPLQEASRYSSLPTAPLLRQEQCTLCSRHSSLWPKFNKSFWVFSHISLRYLWRPVFWPVDKNLKDTFSKISLPPVLHLSPSL